MTDIVTLNVSQQVASIPSDLQRKGAFLSEGGTSLAVGASATITQPADLSPILAGAKAVSSAAALPAGSNYGTTSLAFTQPHGYPVNGQVELVITGALDPRYNGTYVVTAIDAQTVGYSPAGGYPNTAIGPKMVATVEDVSELVGYIATFFAQGTTLAVDILEVGGRNNADEAGDDAGIANLAAFITNNPDTYYAYCVPKSWPDRAPYLPFLQQFQGLQKRTYFFTTVRLDNYQVFSNLDKEVFALVEAPATPAFEMTIAAAFYAALKARLSGTSKLQPFSFRYVYGVTPYPKKGNAALLATLKAANVNVVATASEAGVTNTMLTYGRMMDGRPYNYWFAVDWACINAQRDLALAIVNGSNTSVNPLYYNQRGIDRLETTLAGTFLRGVTFGCVLGTPVQLSLVPDDLDAAIDAETYQGQTLLNAIPFIPYGTSNPGDYRQGIYDGLSAQFVPQAGFEAITLNMVVSDFAAQ